MRNKNTRRFIRLRRSTVRLRMPFFFNALMNNTIEDLELYGLSNSDISVDLGKRFKNYRIALNLTQKEVSEQSGVSVMTLVRFESGEFGSIGLNKFIALMRALQLLENIADVIPDMPESLYDKRSIRNQRQRASKRKK